MLVSLALAPSAHAQQAPASGEHPMPDQAAAPGGVEYPTVHFSGFADIDFSAQKRTAGARGFTEGQLALHLAAGLSPRVNFFGEVSLTPRVDAGSGTPPASGYNVEVERLLIRFDHSDRLKFSVGRYHTPVSYWNTAFHHGSWLQTTISRPEMIEFGSRFIPVHFVGALFEGSTPAKGATFGYQAGIGNGRGSVLSRAGDAGDANARPAGLATFWVRPDRFYGLQFGGAFYADRVSTTGMPEFNEQITSAHVVWERETPEVIAEVTRVRHEGVAGGPVTASHAFYVQAAYRLPDPAHLWKPYLRFEHIGIPSDDVLFAGIRVLDGTTVGVRYDVTTYAALKGEFRSRRRAAGTPIDNGGFLQVCFTF
jgi:hypothetical protein